MRLLELPDLMMPQRGLVRCSVALEPLAQISRVLVLHRDLEPVRSTSKLNRRKAKRLPSMSRADRRLRQIRGLVVWIVSLVR